MRRRKFGSVRRLPSGRWQARLPGPGGELVPANRTFATSADAAHFLATVETDMARGNWVDPRSGAVTLAEYSWAWLQQRTVRGRPLAPRTVDTYRHSLESWILPTLGDRPLDAITPALVRRWHADISRQTGPNAVRQSYAVLRAVMNTAVDDEALHRNPCRIKGAGQSRSPERPLIGLDQVDALVAAMPPHLKAMTVLAFWAHTRLGEVLALTRADVLLDTGQLRIARQVVEIDQVGPRVTEPKAGSRRTISLPDPAIEALREHLATIPRGLPSARLFTREDGGELRAHHLHAAWDRARVEVGLPHVHFHDLRHAGLTLSAQTGATLAEVMRRAGHSSAAAALRYQHAAEERDVEIAARLSAVAAERKSRGTGAS